MPFNISFIADAEQQVALGGGSARYYVWHCSVLFHSQLLGCDAGMSGGLHARLCHAFSVNHYNNLYYLQTKTCKFGRETVAGQMPVVILLSVVWLSQVYSIKRNEEVFPGCANDRLRVEKIAIFQKFDLRFDRNRKLRLVFACKNLTVGVKLAKTVVDRGSRSDRPRCRIKAAFHDSDTDTDVLTRILARMLVSVSM